MLVVDASALAPALADDGPDGDTARSRMRGDAAYVALAELLGVVLLTADARLATARGLRCQLDVLG